ncbi:uncharacterized protein LOC143854459 [Tasmannia lanceolata]|uniref:uncharacterized protein LOC143854459 n=1 Tax=Tasmannia lanceolata TaxID=3420 RepID=UPI004064A109
MERPPLSPLRRGSLDFYLNEGLFEERISRENTRSRRFSASNLNSFREETRSFRKPTTISSTASSPGYTSRDQIDPSTYSFTTALKALQARSGSGWECLSSIRSISDGNALNSKWSEAEKYICNPNSGEVPMECLSAKTLSGRAMSSRITESAPLTYSHTRIIHTKPTIRLEEEDQVEENEKREDVVSYILSTRDVGTQSTPHELSPISSSPNSTPPKEKSPRSCKIRAQVVSFHNKQQSKGAEEIGWKDKKETERKEDNIEEKNELSKKFRDGKCSVWCLWMRKKQRRRNPNHKEQ